MPIHVSNELNLVHGLSGFWSAFFQDTAQLEAFYNGVQLNLGQLYLEMLEAVLSPSLEHAPVFSKQYYHLFVVSEDELKYREGTNPQADRYVFTPQNFSVASAPCLMNALLEPQYVLESGRDYSVNDYGIEFFNDPIVSLPGFPVRNVVKAFPATFVDPLQASWATAGVKPGDVFRIRMLGSTSAFTVNIRLQDGHKLYLDSALPEFSADFSLRSFKVSALRTPFDSRKTGLQLEAHPTLVVQLGTGASSANVVPGFTQIDFGSEPYYRGAWVASTVYAEGDLALNPSGELIRAKAAHTAGLTFDSSKWDPLLGNYVYVEQPTAPQNNGLAQVVGNIGGAAMLSRTSTYVTSVSTRAKVHLVAFSTALGNPVPKISLAHSFIVPKTFHLNARREHDVTVMSPTGPVTYPAGQAVIEGVDYVLDYETGTLTVLSGWDPFLYARASYEWQYELESRTYINRGLFAAMMYYPAGTIVRYNETQFVCSADHFAVSFDATKWVEYSPVFYFDQTHSIRQLALWGADVLYDRQTLYENFGYLLAFKRPSSEQYRAFLKGIAQLFVLGPTLGRFESALNVMAGLPVIRDDGEVLTAYDSGITASGVLGQTIDSHDGRDGALNSTLSTFTSPSANFLTSDVGAQLRVRIGTYETLFVVTAVASPTTVSVTPAPASDATNVRWVSQHVALTAMFRTSEYVFSDADREAEIWIESASHAANVGRFKIKSIENANTVILETPYAFRDETAVRWKLSRSRQQAVTTSRATYVLPYHIPVRADIKDPASLNVLMFKGFEALSSAFYVTDYVQDPNWWHNIEIPKELLSLQVETASRRRASPALIEHTLSPLDGAALGDVGLWVGADEEGREGTIREGTATWFGGDSIVLSGPDAVAQSRDVGRYVQLQNAQYKILGADGSGRTLKLERFPSKALKVLTPPQTMPVKLPTLIYRRTVGFVLMDKLLKYHALRVQVDASVPLSSGLLAEALDLLRQAKPAYTTVYLDTPLTFYERVIATESVDLTVGAPVDERVRAVDNTIYAGDSSLEFDDAYRFARFTQSIAGTVGSYTLTPTLPAAGAAPRTVRFYVVKGRFDLSATISGRRIVEGIDYLLDRELGVVEVLQALPGPLNFNYWVTIIRKRLVGDVLEDAETRICLGGANPTTWQNAVTMPGEVGLIDRAVQLILEP